MGYHIKQGVFTHLVTIMVVGASLALPTHADSKAKEGGKCFATFIFTANDQPLMQPVMSTISRDGAFVSTQRQHSFNLNLECGRGYTVSGRWGDITRHRDFTLAGDGNHIVINMGS